jgi:Xaa-Pro aminopeptidase
MQTKVIEEVRAVKDKKELANIIKAQRISEQVLLDTLPKLKTGVSELTIANFIKKQFVKYGAPILSFPPIVAFGKSSADIHHEPNKTKLKKGDTVMFDIGTTVDHYCSDMTRTYFFGEPSSKQKQVYLDVLKAQDMAVKKLEKGERRAGIIDSIARKFIAKKYKNNFKHGLGHGVGTVIHEWPFFRPKSPDIVPVGCVMTVEPGVYLPGFGGVRIEDMYLITAKSCKNLTSLPKDLKSVVLKA